MSRFFRKAAAPTAGLETSSDPSQRPSPSETADLPPPSSSGGSHRTASVGDKQRLLLRPDPDQTTVQPLAQPTDAELPILRRLREHVEDLIRCHYYDAEGQPRPDGSKNETTGGHSVQRDYEGWEKRWLNAHTEELLGDDDEGGEVAGGWTTVQRYLKASGGNEVEAKKRLESTLLWRRSFQPDIFKPEYIRPEAETGKHLLSGFDKKGRSLLYLVPGRENTKSGPRQIAAITWWLERAIDVLPRGQTKITLVIDFYKASQGNTPSMATSREVLDIVQKHFPERLGLAVIVNSPWWMNAILATLWPFIDPVTKSKVMWNASPDQLCEIIPRGHLQRAYGGDYDYVFERDSYWNQIVQWCGIAPDGSREHECVSKMTPQQEAEWRQQQGGFSSADNRGDMSESHTSTLTPAEPLGEGREGESQPAAAVNGVAATGKTAAGTDLDSTPARDSVTVAS
ncbi:unnamed protein product [Parajaminaea phylloscopi]